LTASTVGAHTAGVDPELVGYLDRRFDEYRQKFVSRTEFQDFRTEVRTELAEIRREIAQSAAETRRHFDVVVESLRSMIQFLAEGILTVDRKLERFAAEVRDEFRRVDRRFLRIEARLGMATDATDA
jgi:hypothetical protein